MGKGIKKNKVATFGEGGAGPYRREGGNQRKRKDFLKAFAELSPEDQEAIRGEIIEKGALQETGDPVSMCHEMMEKMKAGGDPMAVCQEMMQKMKGKCC